MVKVIVKQPKDLKLPDIKLRKLAVDTITHIRQRTVSGKDIHNSSFKKGSKGQKINLVKSGLMIRSLHPTVKKNGFDITLNNRNYIATIHNSGLGNMPKREWFGITNKFKTKILTDLRKLLKIKRK